MSSQNLIVIDSDSSTKSGRSRKKQKLDRNDDKNGSVLSYGDMKLDDFLKHTDLHKWRYVIDIVSGEQLEAIQILIDERHLAQEEMAEKEMKKLQDKADKEIKEGKVQIKKERQTDGSCDATTSESDVSCRNGWSTDFVIMVGNEKRKMQLLVESETCGDSVMGDVSSTEGSIVELEVQKPPVPVYDLESNNKSVSTDKIFASFTEGEILSLAPASECNIISSDGTVTVSDGSANVATTESTGSEQCQPTDSTEVNIKANKSSRNTV